MTAVVHCAPGVDRIVAYPGGPSWNAPFPGEEVWRTDPLTGRLYHLIGPPAPALAKPYVGDSVTFQLDALGVARFRDSLSVLAQQQEQPVQRNTFTFAFKGREIAAAIDAKLADVHHRDDLIDLVDIGNIREALGRFHNELIARVEVACEEARRQVEADRVKWSQERVGYAHAPSKNFDLDADDIAHFGLDITDAA